MPGGAVDTNVFLRVFIQDDGPQHMEAVELVRKCGQVFVGVVVLVEAVWALRKIYGFPRAKLAGFLATVLETDAFLVEDRSIVEAAATTFAVGPGDFADHVILETARRHGADRLYTFDLDFAKVPGTVRLKPGKRR